MLVGAFVFYTIVVAHRRAGRIVELEEDVARLESSNQDLTSLLAVPMRSPLSAIIGASELMITSPDLDLHGRKRLLEESETMLARSTGYWRNSEIATLARSSNPKLEGSCSSTMRSDR